MSNFQFIAKIIAKNSLKTRLHFFFLPRKTLKNAVAAQKSKAQLKNVNKNFREQQLRKARSNARSTVNCAPKRRLTDFFEAFLDLAKKVSV